MNELESKNLNKSSYQLTNLHSNQEPDRYAGKSNTGASIPDEIMEFQKGAIKSTGLNVDKEGHQRTGSKQQLRRPVKLGLERHKYTKSITNSS